MHSSGLFATAVLLLAHGAAGFAVPSVVRTTIAGKSAATLGNQVGRVESRHKTTPRPCRQVVGMSSTVPPQSERTPNVSGSDFDSWFWGDAHVRGGVEHAVFQCADSAVVLFDGECNFCNSGVWMMISNSDAGNMRFCAQNSEMGLSLLHSFGQDQERLSSIAVLNKDGHLFTRSSALVEIMSRMNAPYPLLAALFNAVPESVRDEMYAWVSRRRHAFGTESLSCRIPEEDEVSRFLL